MAASVPSLVLDQSDDIQPLPKGATVRCNDKYVVNYDFSDVGKIGTLPRYSFQNLAF